jgi:hypothetical protein
MTSKRFATLSEDEIVQLELSRYSQKTRYNDQYAERLLQSYLDMKELPLPSCKEELDPLLVSFFASVRTREGEIFSSGGLSNIYQALSRIILRAVGVDIRIDPALSKCRSMILNMKAIAKKKGKGRVKHTEIIDTEDLKIIAQMPYKTPVLLQYKVWMLLHFHFAKRGRENDHQMTKSDIIFKCNGSGNEYVELADTATKNHRVADLSASYGGVMMSTKDQDCPVSILRKYLSKLHGGTDSLWQRPKVTYTEEEPVWYCQMKVGLNKMNTFMSDISRLLKLSKMYTNHTLRATSISILGEQFADTDVSTVSGHKSISNMNIYKKTSVPKKCEMSAHLHKVLTPQVNLGSSGNSILSQEPLSCMNDADMPYEESKTTNKASKRIDELEESSEANVSNSVAEIEGKDRNVDIQQSPSANKQFNDLLLSTEEKVLNSVILNQTTSVVDNNSKRPRLFFEGNTYNNCTFHFTFNTNK